MDPYDKVVNSHKVSCRGIDNKGLFVLDVDHPTDVIVKVYRDGHSEPLCRYNNKGVCDTEIGEELFRGKCPYISTG